MHYHSTRGEAPELGFADVLLTGLARDGGLYVPADWPALSFAGLAAMRGQSYAEVARTVMTPFVGDAIPADDLARMIDDAYAEFRHPAVTPLVQLDANDWVLELFHGPTLAFKDVAMQILARLMDHVLALRGQRATIVCATSGDTGGAAVEAFKTCERVDIFVLLPDGKVSDVQRRQMTTVGGDNVRAVAIDGTFDDCQALVKAMFNDFGFRDRVGLSGVNSINWARIMAQVVYYVTAAVALGAPERAVSFTVPTGNFGDILAGFVAKRMGLPVDRLVIATNRNDILRRALATGRYETTGVDHTQSPSMDIQVSSNFERALFDAMDGDPPAVKRLMGGLTQSGAFAIPAHALDALRGHYDAASADEAETAGTMRATHARTGYLADPHTAVGIKAAAECRGNPATPMVTLATAHPAKFPDAVEAATGIRPALPPHLADLLTRNERISRLPNDLAAVQDFVLGRTRAGAERGAA